MRADLEELLKKTSRDHHVPGMAAAIATPRGSARAFLGVTSVDHPLEVNETTLFSVGSITKVFTATAMMIHAGRGEIDLDVPLIRYLAQLRLGARQAGESLTLRHVLAHCSGLEGDSFRDTGRGDDALELAVENFQQLPQLFPVGRFYSYNNIAFRLAGRILELLNEMPYEKAIEALILKPLRLTSSLFFADEAITGRVAAGHTATAYPEVVRPWGLPRNSNSHAGLVMTIDDLLSFGLAHCEDSFLLSEDLRQEMQKAQLPKGDGNSVGLGWTIIGTERFRLLRHAGARQGQTSLLLVAPGLGSVIAVMANSDKQDAIREVEHWALDKLELGKEPVYGSQESAPLRSDALQCEGLFINGYREVQVSRHGGDLAIEVTPGSAFTEVGYRPPPSDRMPLEVDGLEVRVTSGSLKDMQGQFLLDDDLRIKWLRLEGRVGVRDDE